MQHLSVVGQQRDVEIPRIEELADDAVHRGIELVEVGCGVRELGDPEQRLLDAHAALALLDLQRQRLRALLDPPLEFLLRQLAVQRGDDVAAHVGEQRLVGRCVAWALHVALDHQHRAHAVAGDDRHAQPVEAVGADVAQRPGYLRAHFRQRSHQGALVADRVPGQPLLEHFHRQEGVGVPRERVLRIHQVDEADRVLLVVVQRDVEVLGVHETADDAVQLAQHVAQVHVRTGHVRHLEQRRLQLLRAFELVQRVREPRPLEHRARHRAEQVAQRAHARQQGAAAVEHHADAVDLLHFDARRHAAAGVIAGEAVAIARAHRQRFVAGQQPRRIVRPWLGSAAGAPEHRDPTEALAVQEGGHPRGELGNIAHIQQLPEQRPQPLALGVRARRCGRRHGVTLGVQQIHCGIHAMLPGRRPDAPLTWLSADRGRFFNPTRLNPFIPPGGRGRGCPERSSARGPRLPG
jgi:hypothetical protein